MSADTIPPGGVPLEHPWCPPDRRYPESYAAAIAEDPARCVAEDPCLPDGTTLWTLQPCVTTTTVVAVDDPPTLPATGSGSVLLVAAFAVTGLGLLVRKAVRL